MTVSQRDSCRNFDRQFPIGTKVKFLLQDGSEVETATASHAGECKGKVSVFVESQQQPVPIDRLHIDGYDLVFGKRARAS